MKKTAQQPAGGQATNQKPLPISDRPELSYHEGKGRTLLDKVVLWVVVIIAAIVIALSFRNTSLLALELGLNPYLAAGLVEILFGSLLFIRGRQRALQRNVPLFLTIGYFVSLAFVTSVNMWGLSQENLLIGPVVGAAISGAMWLMESTMVWLWVDSHKPHVKTVRELKREAKEENKKLKLIQQIEWMRYEASKPDLDLIRKAREADEKRKDVVAKGLPEFFKQADNETHQVDKIMQADNSETDQADEMEEISQPQQEKKAEKEDKDDHLKEQAEMTEKETEQSEEMKPVKAEAGEEKKKKTINFKDKKDEYKDRIRKKAYELWEKENKRPGRTRIQKYTGCSQNLSREIADELREEEKKKSKQVS